jgi:predicted O-methyltransferase YrrM
MSQEQWNAVDDYVAGLFLQKDEVLEHALQASNEAGLPAINVSPVQGKLLMLLALSIKAKRILEIGTLGGYSTIWLARALPSDGRLVTLEYEPKHAAVAEQNLKYAGLNDKVEIMVGKAVDTLPGLSADSRAPFDLIFIDADKDSYAEYFELSLRLSRPGTLLIADNVVRDGNVVQPDHSDPRVQGIRRFNERVSAEPRVSATVIQTVGTKGYDGLAVIYVTEQGSSK